jgi:hypothetical protein
MAGLQRQIFLQLLWPICEGWQCHGGSFAFRHGPPSAINNTDKK